MNADHFNAFLQMVHGILPLELADYGHKVHLSTYEVKLLVCGLSKAFFRVGWTDLPFKSEDEFENELRSMATRISSCLYWLKLQEDANIYFNSKIMHKRAAKLERKLTSQPESSSAKEEELIFDDEEEQEIGLIDYLLQFYLKLTPNILDQ